MITNYTLRRTDLLKVITRKDDKKDSHHEKNFSHKKLYISG